MVAINLGGKSIAMINLSEAMTGGARKAAEGRDPIYSQARNYNHPD